MGQMWRKSLFLQAFINPFFYVPVASKTWHSWGIVLYLIITDLLIHAALWNVL